MKINKPLQAWCIEYALKEYRKENNYEVPVNFSIVVNHARNVYSFIESKWAFKDVSTKEEFPLAEEKCNKEESVEKKAKAVFEEQKLHQSAHGGRLPDWMSKAELLVKEEEEERLISCLLEDIRKWELKLDWDTETVQISKLIKTINKEYKITKR